MRKTLQLEGERRAVIDIPYEKLTSLTGDRMKQTSQSCQQGIVITPCCRGRDNSLQMKQMVYELELAYDEDTKQLKDKIAAAERDRDECRQQNARIKIDLSGREKKIEEMTSSIELLRVSCKQKDVDIARLIEERDIISRNKITQFRQSEYRRWHEQEQLVQHKQIQITDLSTKLQAVQLQKIRGEEENAHQRLRDQESISRLTVELNQSVKRFTRESEKQALEWRVREEENEKRTRVSKQQVEHLQAMLKLSQSEQESVRKEISRVSELLHSAEEGLSKREKEVEAALHEQSVLSAQVSNLGEKLSASNHIIASLDNQKGHLLLEISDLRKELTQKERVCEVKIERVVDGKERIGELERAVFELELQLKQLSQEKEELGEEVRRRQNTVDELNGRIFKLEAEVKTLKAYIEKREGGFKWTVEREIEKDMVISQQKPEAYKVYQVREYSRETALDNRTHVAESIANSLQQTFFNNQTEQIVITEQRLFN